MKRAVFFGPWVMGLIGCCLLVGSCFMPQTPTPHVGQTRAPDETSAAQGVEPLGQPGVPTLPVDPPRTTSTPVKPTPRALPSPTGPEASPSPGETLTPSP